jgi:hypothetical protein
MGADAHLRLIRTLAASALVAGCVAPGTLDGVMPVNLHVWTTPTTVEVDAPGWLADLSTVYLCPTDPPRIPDAAADRVDWTPGGGCHDYGTHPSRDGLTVSLPLVAIEGEERAAFEAAEDWYLLLLDFDGDRVSMAVRSRFHAPGAFTAR